MLHGHVSSAALTRVAPHRGYPSRAHHSVVYPLYLRDTAPTRRYEAERVNAGDHDAELGITAAAGASPGTKARPASHCGGSGSWSSVPDRPLLCQLAGNDVEAMVAAGKRVQVAYNPSSI